MTAIQQQIDVFVNKAQKKIANLSHQTRDESRKGMGIDDHVDLIQELKASVYLFQDDHYDLSDTQAMEVISYLNRKAELTILPFSFFDSSCFSEQVSVPGGFLEGPTGPTGPQGTQGPTGATGADGEDGEDGADGNDGWSSIPSLVTDGARKVIKITGWTGGTGTAPASDLYIGSSGFVSDISDAVDIRGAQGIQGIQGIAGTGSAGVSSYTYIAYADDDSGTGFTTTFDETKDYIGIRTTTSPISPVTSIAFSGLWKNYKGEQGDSFEIDAQGPLVDRDAYDAEAKGFTFLNHDGGDVYIKKSSFPGDWSDPFPFIGYSGWNPIPAVIIDGDRRVLQIVGWAGGEGVEPDATGMYIGNTGIVGTAPEAEDIRGPIGERFFPDEEGDIADRDDFDDELTDFIYHAVDEGKVYIKLSDTSADWSAGFTWRGAAGVAGLIGPAGIGFNDECIVATTADLAATYSGVGKTLTANANGVLTIDGVTLTLNARILVKNESTGADNGIYIATDLGSAGSQWVLTRADDFNTTLEAKKFFRVFIEQGTANQGTSWEMTNSRPALVLDTTALVFAEDTISGTNLVFNGSSTIKLNLSLLPGGETQRAQIGAAVVLLGDVTQNQAPTFIEFFKGDGVGSPIDLRASFGFLGSTEVNNSINMDYNTGSHKYYDPTIPALWSYLGYSSGYGLQYVPANNANSDIFNNYGCIPFKVDIINQPGTGQGIDGFSKVTTAIINLVDADDTAGSPNTPAQIYLDGGIMKFENASGFDIRSTHPEGATFYQLGTGTGADLKFTSSFTPPTGNSSQNSYAIGATVGYNVAHFGEALNGNINVGLIGKAITLKNGATNVGVIGIGNNQGTSPIRLGGYFGLGGLDTPTFENSVITADNGSTGDPIFLAKSNTTTVVSILDNGRLIGVNDFISDNSANGLVLKSSNDNHYYRYTAGVAGALVITDLGTSY